MQQPCHDFDHSCTKVVYQSVDVDLPIRLTPQVKVGDIKLCCQNEPVVNFCQNHCGDGCGCEIRITQTVAYQIPIEYHVGSTVCPALCQCKKDTP